MNRKVFAVTLALLCFAAVGVVWGATTGKITGVVTDLQSKEPLVGVVSVVGTNLGAITDQDGKYTIINVPVGTYTLKMTAVGYASLEVSNVRVSADLATYQDQELSSKATDLGKTIEVTAEIPLVIKDKTTTVDIVSREELLSLPTRGFEQVVGIQNSVVRMNSNVDIRQRGAPEASATAPEINLRGGRPSEVAYYVDGFSQQDPLSGLSTANINNNAIKEVSVTSGAFSAQYGHVASGIVNVTTNSGSDEYHGNAEVVSDNLVKSMGYDSFDQNWYSADFSGPIPGLDKAYFFLSGERRWLGDRSPSSVTKKVYEEFGTAGLLDEPQRMPNNQLSGWSYQGKIDYNFTPNFKLGLSGNGSVDYWQEYRHYYYNPAFPTQVQHSPRYRDKNLGLNAKITHTLSPETFYNLSASYFDTERLRADGVIWDQLSEYERAVANPEYDRFNLFREGDSVYAADLNPLIEPGSEADTFVTFYQSYWDNYLDRRASYIGFKGDITSQVNSHNTMMFGFDFQRHTVRYFEFLGPTQGYNDNRVNRYGFDSTANTSNSQGYENDTKHPINLGVYLQDRFEFRGLIVNAGLRFDYFDYKSQQLVSVTRPLDPNNTGLNEMAPDRLTASEKFTRLSPRLGVSFPVSDRTQMHINYGIFFQRPDLRRLYVGYDFLAARISAGSYYPFPSPNLKPETMTQYEVGITHQLGQLTAMSITAYYKDTKDLTQIFHQSPAFPFEYDFFGNTDYGTIKGVDFNMTMRRTHNIALNVKYSLSYATGTGSYAQSGYNIAWKNPQGTPKMTAPLDYDQRHSIIGIFDFRTGKAEGPVMGNVHPFENLGLNVVAQLGSGTPYTPMQIYDAVSPNAAVTQIPTNSINSANMPWQFSIDFKLERGFTIGAYRLTPYLWVRNLLDRDNILAVYEGTGEPNTSGYLDTPEGQTRAAEATYGPEFAYRYDYAQNNPKNYSNPRMFIFGLRMSF
jgi:outer membrane receptor protein involved in Fe transport